MIRYRGLSPLTWVEDDLEVTGWELLKAFVVAPVLLAAFVVVCLFIYLWTPA